MEELNHYIDKIGGQAEFAKRLGCSKQLVNFWYTGRTKPSPRMATEIERTTNGYIKRADLLPDIFGDVA